MGRCFRTSLRQHTKADYDCAHQPPAHICDWPCTLRRQHPTPSCLTVRHHRDLSPSPHFRCDQNRTTQEGSTFASSVSNRGFVATAAATITCGIPATGLCSTHRTQRPSCSRPERQSFSHSNDPHGHSPAKSALRSPSHQDNLVCPARRDSALRCVLRDSYLSFWPSFNPDFRRPRTTRRPLHTVAPPSRIISLPSIGRCSRKRQLGSSRRPRVGEGGGVTCPVVLGEKT